MPTKKKIPDGEVTLVDDHGAPSTIKKLRSDEPNKGLGCRQAVDGSMTAEFKHRSKQCMDLMNKVAVAKLTCNEAHLLMQSRILKTIAYPMPVTSFTKDQCKQLNTTMDKVMLNKYQLNRKMPKAVIYSPCSIGGMNYPSFLILQDQMKTMNLLKQLRWNKTVSNN